MNNIKEFDVSVGEDYLQERLKELFKDPEHGAIMAECIVSLMDHSESKLSVLFQTTIKINRPIIYSVGDEVLCNINYISTWGWDETEMKNQGMIKDNHIKATIKQVKKHSTYPYVIEYTYIHNNTTEVYSDDIRAKAITRLVNELVE